MTFASAHGLPAACVALLSSVLAAQGLVERIPVDPTSIAEEQSRDGTFGVPFSISGGSSTLEWVDGALLAIGDDYKAVLDEHGIRFTPALGRSVPTNQPLRLQLESIHRGETSLFVSSFGVQPRPSGRIATYERGEITERYEVRPDGVEQSFVFPSEPLGDGDLVVRLKVETPMDAPHGQGLGELQFRVGDAGGIDVGAVVGIDARGRRQTGHMNYSGTHLELVLPASFVRTAAYPLVLDPPISTRLNLASDSAGALKPDVAYLAALDRYLVVWEHPYSASDTDIRAQRVDSCGRLIGALIHIDNSTADEREPHVAMNVARRCFVVTYQRGAIGSRNIIVRTVEPTSGSRGPELVAAGTAADEYEPSVGGETFSTGTEVPVVWCDANAGIRWGEFTVNADGSMFFRRGFLVENNPSARRPVISRSGGASRRYLVAWETRGGNSIGARFMDANSNPLSQSGYVSTGNRNPLLPSVDGDGSRFALSYSRQEVSGTNTEFDVWFIDLSPPSTPTGLPGYTSHVPIEDTQGDDDLISAIASINGRSVVAIEDRVGGVGTAYELWASGRASDGRINGNWYNVGDRSPTTNRNPAVASRQSGGTSFDDALFAWASIPSSGPASIKGVLYSETFTNGSFANVSPGCGSLTITTRGLPVIGQTVNFRSPSLFINDLLILGFAQRSTLICSGCTLGTDPLVSFSIPIMSGLDLAIPFDPCLIGAEAFVQGISLLGAGNCLAGRSIELSSTIRMRIGG
ncbi:MAG: hypothetical protein AB7I19_18165 [Planctomycetota bacterium]